MKCRQGTELVARVFKALGNEARLEILCCLSEKPCSVSELVEKTEISQPLVSQHLRTLRQVQLVVGKRTGKEITYSVSDHHVSHVIGDAYKHVTEGE